MTFDFSRVSMVALILGSLSGTTAIADVTAQDIWEDWQAYLSGSGYEVTGTENTSGNTLTVSDIRVELVSATEGAEVLAELSELQFVENGDGTVNVVLPETLPIAISSDVEGGLPFSGVVNYKQTGFEMVASGDPDNITYDYKADEIFMSLTDVVADGQTMGLDAAKIDVVLGNVTGNTRVTASDLRNYKQYLNAETMTYDLAFNDPETADNAMVKGGSENLEFNGTSVLPDQMDPNDMNAALQSGFAGDGTFTYTNGNSQMDIDADGSKVAIKTTSESGTAKVGLGLEGLIYDVGQTGLTLNMTGADIPFPIDLNMAQATLNMLIPVVEGADEQDFALGLKLGDFTMSDAIWNLFDPATQLPRDPATVELDLAGKATMLMSLFAPETAAELESPDAEPVELNALTLNNLLVSAVGANLTGKGDFTFDNSDKTSFDGMPKPTGAIDLQLIGGNGLLDKLVSMGLLPEEDAMGARMMMGLFAVPGDGEDTLNSKIEVNEEGHILANGQRIQ